jgi:O-antigen ligase
MTEANYEPFPLASQPTPVSAQPPSQTAAVPLMLTLIAVTVFLPEESSFSFGGFRMTLVRVLLLILAPFTVLRFADMFSKPSYRFVWADALVPIYCVWMIIAPAIAESLDRGLVFGGIAAVETFVPYMAMRSLTQHGQALKIVKTLLYAISVVGLLGLLDWATSEWFIRNLASKITGYTKIVEGQVYTASTAEYYRFGLLRASSTIEHPILLGTICAFGVLLSTAYHGWSRWVITISCLIGLVAALSSAPIGSFVIGISLMIYDKVFRNIPSRRMIILGISLLVVAIIFIGSSNPLAFIFSKVCFDPTTAAYRVMEWQVFWPFVMDAPIFGIGTGQGPLSEDILPSVDSLWLRSAMLYGIPGMVLTAAVFLGCASIRVDLGNPTLNLTPDEKKLALALDVIVWVVIYVATTVYFWGATWILTVLILGLRAHIGNLASLPPDAEIVQDRC